MPITQFTSLDFDQIKAQIKDYLAANSNFSDFDFEGSNFAILIDTLAYNTYINAFNANLVANESFLDSATLRENVVSLARNIGYVPRSKTAAKASITFSVEIDDAAGAIPFVTLKPGLIAVGNANDTTYRFSIPESISAIVENVINPDNSVSRVATFGTQTNPISVFQGSLVESKFLAMTNQDQRFILDNSSIDSSTIVVFVGQQNTSGLGRQFKKIDNILNLNQNSEIFLVQEIQDEKFEIIFGDSYFGKALENNDSITARYIVTDGADGNGARTFDFQGTITDQNGAVKIPKKTVNITTVQGAVNGSEIENINSIKYLAPRTYSAQYRAVTPRDYEAIISQIYPQTESVAVVGGEEMDPPQFGTVRISIKPRNGTYVSDFDKQMIKSKLKSYAIAGINSKIVDLKVLYVEIDSTIYYNTAQIDTPDALKSKITSALTTYANTVDINKFGGRFKYSKTSQLIDRVHNGITSNITKVKIRRDLKALIDQSAQYELCFGNRFHINQQGANIKSTGFMINGYDKVVYLTDVPNKDENGNLDGSMKGNLGLVSRDANSNFNIVGKSVGTVDYKKGEILLNTIHITSTVATNNIIEIQAFPDSNDIIGLKDLYLSFDVSKSKINMVKDVIASGEDVSGIVFSRDYYTSSYSNGELERK
ncbi:MAG: baseplate wedge protein [Flavobacteriales bacterium TMED228]|nr:MAG: baseplate wedge protein [Flavobacteriales bacterium TMED228]|tara:strand:+ start:745 stop:2706 length:1962 start_codon:yes stop_codon:yes gene_type:complete